MAKISERWKDTPEGKRVKVYIIRYQDKAKLSATGKPTHRQESFDRKKQAEARLLQIQNELVAGTHVARGATVTVTQAADLFLKQAEDRVRDGRIGKGRHRCLRNAIDGGIIPFLGAYKLTELTPTLIEDCYRRNLREAKVLPATAKRRISTLKLIVEFAIRRGLMRENPVLVALQELRGISDRKVKVFTSDQVTRLLRAIDSRALNVTARGHLSLKLYVHVAAFCGLRWGEISALTVSHVDIDRRTIRVRHSLTAWDELKGPKTQAGIRDVPLPPHVVALFREWLATFYRENERGLLFTGRHSGRGASSSNFHEKQWHPLLKRAGLHDADPFHFHALRHFAASWWIGNGMPLTDVAKLMGHSKVDMTMQVYAHSLSNNSIRSDMVDRMSRALIEAPVVLDAEAFVPSVAPDARFPPNSLF